jgi:hypothetical protein
LSGFVAPVVTAAAVSGALSYLVAKTTARSTVASARIGATVEREKLDHSREARRAQRRDQASKDLIALTEQMEIVANREILRAARDDAARKARLALVAVVITLQDDTGDSPRVTGLVDALKQRDLERATGIWAAVSAKLIAGKLA